MSNAKNTVHLLGHLGKDVELQDFSSGSKKATISLATSDFYKNADGELVSNTQWHNVVAWGKTAEFMSNTLSKGEQVAITGSINYRSYKDKNGENRTITEILVSSFSKVSKSAKSA